MGTDLLLQYFPHLSSLQIEQFEKLLPLYKEWNDKINVVSRKDIDELYLHHVLHSLSIARFYSFQTNEKIMDLGTGGGFPGIPLAIVFPHSHFHLVDSIGKKIKVVEAVANSIDLKNISYEHNRAEKVEGLFDYIVTRAVAPARQIWQWGQGKIRIVAKKGLSNGIIALKGGDLKEEIKELKRNHQLQSISDYFKEPYFESKQILYIPR